MKILVLVVVAVVAVVVGTVSAGLPSAHDLLVEEWKAYKLKYEKSYSAEEDEYRMSVFKECRERMALHNQRYYSGEETYKRGLNQFSDMTSEEFNLKNNGFISRRSKGHVVSAVLPRYQSGLPTRVNWVEKGAVTPVKDQMLCNSCWAFSAAGVLESQHFIQTNQMVSLSEQNLIDCTSEYTNYTSGCSGGNTDTALNYVYKNEGIDTEKYYPYEAKQANCRYEKSEDAGVRESYLYQLPSGNEELLELAVALRGPVAVAVDGTHVSFQEYAGGIYFDKRCTNYILNHAMLVVGYDEDYWLLKNSYGTKWGEEGYMRLARNRREYPNHCGVASEASLPLLW